MPDQESAPDRNGNGIFADLEQLAQESGFVYSFCLMVARCLWMSTDDVAEIDWTERPNQEELSLLLGLLVKHPIRLDAIPSEGTILAQAQRATELLQELHLFLASPALPNAAGSDVADADSLTELMSTYEDWMTSGKGMVEPIFYGGQGAYSFQFLEMARKKYAADANWIQQYKGTGIDDIVEIASKLESRTLERLQGIKRGITLSEECKAILSAMTFCLDDLPTADRQSFEHFISAFSFTPGNINQEFKAITDYNTIHSRPVMLIGGGQFCIPIFPNLPKAIYDNPFYWIWRSNNGPARRG